MADWLRVSVVLALAFALGPALALGPNELAVVVNLDDPLSVSLADRYMAAREIPAQNRIEVRLPTGQAGMGSERFQRVRARVLAQTPSHVQAYVLVWSQPFRVTCMSITTAFAAGFDESWCAKPCAVTRRSPYYDSEATSPWETHRLRPTMLLAALDESEGRALMERGIAADGTRPKGVGYLVETADRRRNVRAPHFPALVREWRGRFDLRHVRTDAVRDAEDVMFYFTGAKHVPALQSNEFLPGAVADHLTSSGGRLVGGPQMSILRWLEAGATASYGAVLEPCAHADKFPRPRVLLKHYLAGDTVLEAYWKSVAMPGQGLFVGEPLARPFAAPAPSPAPSAASAGRRDGRQEERTRVLTSRRPLQGAHCVSDAPPQVSMLLPHD